MAVALAAASALAAPAVRADDPLGSWRAATLPGAAAGLLGRSWVELELRSTALQADAGPAPSPAGAPRLAIAGATLRNLNGWSASLFVSRALAGAASEEAVRIPGSIAVNARLSRRLSCHSSVTLDVFNLLDRRAAPLDDFMASRLWSPAGMPEDFLVHPGESRGLRLAIRRTF